MTHKKTKISKNEINIATQFKEQAVERAKKDGVPKAAKNLGIPQAMLYSWRKSTSKQESHLKTKSSMQLN